MIINNVMLKLKNPNGNENELVQSALLSMKGKIDALLDIQVESNVRPEEGAYDILFITKFASMEDLDAYLAHRSRSDLLRCRRNCARDLPWCRS